MDIHIDQIKRLNNKFKFIWCQSDLFKNLYIKAGINDKLIKVKEPIGYKYDFVIPKRNDNNIILIYSGTLRDEENILEIIEEFSKIHEKRPKILLKIIYGKIHGNKKFVDTMNEIIKNGVTGITFKNNLSHRDTCYEIATSHIGICWRKNKWGENGEISTKVKEYKTYGLNICFDLTNIYVLNDILGKTILGNNFLIINDNLSYEYLYIESYSKVNKNTPIQISIDKTILPESSLLLNNEYLTPNYIDNIIWKNFKLLNIEGDSIKEVKITKIKRDDIKCFDKSYLINHKLERIKFTNLKTFDNKIAYIGDIFTFNSLKDIINIDYISKNDIESIVPSKYDMLFCESTWHGIDESWSGCFTKFEDKKYSKSLYEVVNLFKSNGKKCVYYNKEDPTNWDKFYKSAILFDIIITTSEECISKYKEIYPKKLVYATPFCCNPIIHNPINYGKKKEKEFVFIGGFYRHLNDRHDVTNEMFADVLRNNYKLTIINRHFYMPKFTRQLYYLNNFIGKYEIDNKYKKYNNPPIDQEYIAEFYKTHLININLNTVIDSNTMSSRRLIELLGCGSHVFSNHSKSIDYLKLPLFNNINDIDINKIDDINIDGFYLSHLKFSYITFIEKIYDILGLELHRTFSYKISCTNESMISDNYKKYMNIDEADFHIILNRENYYYNDIFMKKLLLHIYFFDGSLEITQDRNKFYTLDSQLSNNLLIKSNLSENKLYIPDLYTNLYSNCFNYHPYYNQITNNNNIIDKNGILVVMCVWKRLQYLEQTLYYLERQNIKDTINICIWNNNYDQMNDVQRIIDNFKTKKNRIFIHHSKENIGGIGRFILTKYICEKINKFEKVIFIDDDQILKENFISILLENFKIKTGFHWYGKKFYKDRLYMNSWKNFKYKERIDYDYSNFDRNILDYGATCGMIIDTECFLKNEFYLFNKKYQFIEDLWMSYYAINKLNYKLINGYSNLSTSIENVPSLSNDVNAQWLKLSNSKDDFLNVLRKDGEWDV
jgi:hypothetical protein